MADLGKKQILVVDDEEDLLDIMRSLLEGEGYVVATALDGKEAIARIELQTFDLIITGIRMPRMSGLELIAHLRRKVPDQRIIVLAGDSHARLPALEVGALEFIQKPPNTSDLLSSVRRALNS